MVSYANPIYFISNDSRSSPLPPASAAARVCDRATYGPPVAVSVHIAPTVIAATENNYIRPWHCDHAASVTSVHVAHASRQGRQQRNPQPNLDSLNRPTR
jgi:hypothetical protein